MSQPFRAVSVFGTLAGLIGLTSATAQDFANSPCKSPHYVESAQREIASLAKVYSECVRTSDGTNDCSAEFKELKDWQGGLVKAVGLFKERQKIGNCD